MRIVYSILTFFLVVQSTVAQSDNYYLVDGLEDINISKSDSILLDTCLAGIKSVNEDSLKLKWIEVIAEESWDDRIWPKYNQLMYDIAVKNLRMNPESKYYLKYKARAINNFGYLSSSRGLYLKALDFYNRSLEIQKQINDTAGISSGYSNLGVVYERLGDVNKTAQYYNQALKYKIQIGDTAGMAVIYSNLGGLSEKMVDYEKALEYYQKALNLRLKINNRFRIVQSLHELGTYYRVIKKKRIAESYLYRALDMAEQMQYSRYIGLINLQLGILHTKSNPKLAHKHLNKSLSISNMLNNLSDRQEEHHALAKFYEHNEQFDMALVHAKKSYDDAQTLGSVLDIKNSSELLSEYYIKLNDYKKALEYYKISVEASNEIKDTEVNNRITRQKLESEYEKRENKLLLEKKRKIAIANERAKNQQIISYFTIGGAVILLVFLIIIFSRYRLSQKQKKLISLQREELEKKNNLVTDSINYARHIVNAVIPSSDKAGIECKDCFVLYLPKDIVSGDFLWAYKVNEHESITIVADCTGHGVPGAMLSMVCSNILDYVIRKKRITSPEQILETFNLELIYKLNKKDIRDDDIKDGVEMSIYYYNSDLQIAKYAGSGQRIYHCRNKEITQYSGDKIPLGSPKYSLGKKFTLHEISIKENDQIYMFTDGFPDQKGGEKGKKFYYQNFQKLILENTHLDMESQQKALLETYYKFKEGFEQYDDVLVIGLKHG